jgi:16S rRNA C967 or C1407 C5-methylase (RsmB/RsmF family)
MRELSLPMMRIPIGSISSFPSPPTSHRAYMLVHQCRRLNSPLLMVTTHKVILSSLSPSVLLISSKGQEFPTVISDFNQASPSVPVRASRANGVFDRVLCDVPCSGDGTLRKTPNIWAKWGISSASSLYPLQLQIAERGLRLVKCGGILVYSTCSLSPYGESAPVPSLPLPPCGPSSFLVLCRG